MNFVGPETQGPILSGRDQPQHINLRLNKNTPLESPLIQKISVEHASAENWICFIFQGWKDEHTSWKSGRNPRDQTFHSFLRTVGHLKRVAFLQMCWTTSGKDHQHGAKVILTTQNQHQHWQLPFCGNGWWFGLWNAIASIKRHHYHHQTEINEFSEILSLKKTFWPLSDHQQFTPLVPHRSKTTPTPQPPKKSQKDTQTNKTWPSNSHHLGRDFAYWIHVATTRRWVNELEVAKLCPLKNTGRSTTGLSPVEGFCWEENSGRTKWHSQPGFLKNVDVFFFSPPIFSIPGGQYATSVWCFPD